MAETPKEKAPNLTAANALKVVEGVKDWKCLGQYLWIPDSAMANMQRHHSDSRGRKEAVINYWLKTDPAPTWRRLIWALDWAEERHTADSVRLFAEPLTDPTLTLDAVTEAIQSVGSWDRFCSNLGVPEANLNEIQSCYSTDDERREAAVKYWLYCCPDASWSRLAGELHHDGETDALEHVQKYLKKTAEPTLTLENLCQALAEVKDWDSLGRFLCTAQYQLDKIARKCSTPTQAKREMLQYFLTAHPAPSWKVMLEELYTMGRFEARYHSILQKANRRYVKGKELLDEAMKKGYVEALAIKVVVTGAAGSGKTCAKEVILGNKPPRKRRSTKVAERPVRLHVASTKAPKSKKWETITQEIIPNLIADTVRQLAFQQSMETEEESSAVREDFESTILPEDSISKTPNAPTSTSAQPASSADTKHSSKEHKASQQPSTACKQATPTKVKTLPLVSGIEKKLLELIDQAPSTEPVDSFHWVYFVDSGGQPQFHEILPVFLKGASICIFVHKLSERLDEHPMIEYFEDNGEPVGNPCLSAHTNMQVFQHCIRTMQSHGSQAAKGKPPKILILGTHADLEHRCTETRRNKNQKLLEILFPMCPNEIIYNGQDKKEVIFPLNAQEPGEAEQRLAEQIRELIMKESPSVVNKIPLSWYVLEQALQELAQKLGRSVLRKEECFAVASNLHFTEESFLAALQFLDDLNILFYYPDILPEVVFTDPQVVLDKASELVKFSYQLREDPKEGMPFKGEWQKFQDYGLVTAEFLSEFSDHYVEDIFTPKELIKLFKALLILADFSATEFFMPALLRIVDCHEVRQYQSTGSLGSTPLVVYFPRGVHNGVFCSLITFLLSSDNCYPSAWKLHHTAGSPTCTCLNRNCVKFAIPEYAGSLTLVDSFMHFEARINAPDAEFCGFVRDAIFAGLQKSVTVLGYNNSTPKIAFLCPCNDGSTHVATVGAKQTKWICSKDSEKWGLLQDEHRVWLPSTGPEQPTPITSPSSSLSTEPRLKRPKLSISKTEDMLGDGDLFDIKYYLRDLEKSHIYNLGLALGLSHRNVKAMKDSGTFLDDVLAAWLRREDSVQERGMPSWRTLVKALKHPLLGQTGVASDICRDKGIENNS